MKSPVLSAYLVLLLIGGIIATDSLANERTVPLEIIQRAVPFIESEGAGWIAKRDCLSCHHTSFATWSLNSAKSLGVDVDSEQLSEWNNWASDWKHHVAGKNRASAEREKTLRDANDTVAQLIIGGTFLAADVQSIDEYLNFLVAGQQHDGSWKAGGQLPMQKRPARETTEASTLWALIALASATDQRNEFQPTIDKGLAWLGDQTEGVSTEWWAGRTLLARKLGDRVAAGRYSTGLRKRQRPDGGWGWLAEDGSDALGTAQALYALAGESVSVDDPAIAKAIRFLGSTQRGDGSWQVNGTKKQSADEETSTANFWGTSWAVIALCELLTVADAR